MEEGNGKISHVVESSAATTNKGDKKVKVVQIVSHDQRQAPRAAEHDRVRHDTNEYGALGDHDR